jgi:hypothetical protein
VNAPNVTKSCEKRYFAGKQQQKWAICDKLFKGLNGNWGI